jgi:hypothetical protein
LHPGNLVTQKQRRLAERIALMKRRERGDTPVDLGALSPNLSAEENAEIGNALALLIKDRSGGSFDQLNRPETANLLSLEAT